MSKLLAKQFYLEQLKLTGDHHRRIANRLTERFQVSAAQIKNELLEEGYIKLKKVVRMGETQKNNYFYVLTGKKFIEEEQKKNIVVVDTFWPCGTKKSTGNAFDLSTARGLFTRAEIANAVNKGRPNNYNAPVQIIAYSRA